MVALSLFLLLTNAAAARAQGAPSNLTFEGGESFGVPFELVDNRIFATREGLKNTRRKSVRLTVQSGERAREVVVKLRDLV